MSGVKAMNAGFDDATFEILNRNQKLPVHFMQDGVCIINRDRRFVWVNAAFERLLGSTSEQIVGSECCCDDIVKCRDEFNRPLSGVLCPVNPMLGGETPVVRQRMQITRADGTQRWLETIYAGMPIEGEGEYILGVARDVSDNVEREHDLLRAVEMLERQIQSMGGTLIDTETTRQSPPTEPAAEPSMNLDACLAHTEREVILRALEAAGWHRNKAAELMGISRSRLYRRMEALGIDPNVHP
jgi:PAS domain S-box-containing protein